MNEVAPALADSLEQDPAQSFAGDVLLTGARRVAASTGAELRAVMRDSGQHRWAFDCACYNDEKSRAMDRVK